MTSFENLRQDILLILHIASEQLETIGFAERIKAAKLRLEREEMQVLVVGEFSRGKSTFINALLGQPVLPSKVNPTTAAITIINGYNERTMKVIYNDGKVEVAALPNEKVNKFLDEYITTINQDANKIKNVEISWPGLLAGWGGGIVDTPGVNDLDELREEVTYKYLSQADACIVVLDSQQPLSESERNFLKDKVMTNDINRLLFVINRIDEVDSEPNGEAASRIIKYVENLIKENLPMLVVPKVHAVSAKEALRARFKNQPSSWQVAFDNFEKHMLNFINDNASKGRIPEHLERAMSIIQDGMTEIREKKKLLFLSDKELQDQIKKMELEEGYLTNQLNALFILLDGEAATLTSCIRRSTENLLNNLKLKLKEGAEHSWSDDNLTYLKTELNRGLRGIIENITEQIEVFKGDVIAKVETEFPLLAKGIRKNPSLHKQMLAQIDYKTNFTTVSHNPIQSENTEDVFTQLAVGGAVGYITGAMFGPIGIAAAVFGMATIGGQLEEKKRHQELERMRVETIGSLLRQIDIIISNAEDSAQEITSKEIDKIRQYFSDIVRNRFEVLQQRIQENKNNLAADCRNIENEGVAPLTRRLEKLKEVEQEILVLRSKLTYGIKNDRE